MQKLSKSKLNKKFRGISRTGVIVALVLVCLIGGVVVLRSWYTNNLRPVSSSQSIIYFTVASGDSRDKIAENLHRSGLIRSSTAFKNYIRTNEIQNLQAGTYKLSPSMGVAEIVNRMVKGDVAKNLLTILPGKRLDQIKDAFSKAGYSSEQIANAFNPANYFGHPALNSLPKNASLEGYLYPDSFQQEADTPAELIVRESLDEMQKHLTGDIINGFTAQGLNPHQGITLSSIVLQETDNPDSQKIVAQVFLSRLKQNISLGSDVTAFYASDLANVARSVNVDSPYNTRLHSGLPPGPIGNVTANALYAVSHPANTDYLYFVAGDDDKMHFSHTQQEHEDAVRQYCHKKCSEG
jgi:UPF0755 protein